MSPEEYEALRGPMIDLVFFRTSGFYTVPCPTLKGQTLTQVAAENAVCNPGTTRVEDVAGNVLWSAQNAKNAAFN